MGVLRPAHVLVHTRSMFTLHSILNIVLFIVVTNLHEVMVASVWDFFNDNLSGHPGVQE